MNSVRRARGMASGMVVVAALAGSVLAFDGRARASDTAAEVSAEQEALDLGASGSEVKTRWQQRQERQRARVDQFLSRRPDAAPREAVPTSASLAAATVTDIDVSFRLDRRLTAGLYMGDRWVASPPTYSGVREGVLTVDARAEGRDARGRRVAIAPEWRAENPAMVTISPARGKEATITVHRAGQSSVRVTVRGESEERSVSGELSIKAWYRGTALEVEISPSAATRVARQGPTGRNGWKFVGGEAASHELHRPVLKDSGWRFVDGDARILDQAHREPMTQYPPEE